MLIQLSIRNIVLIEQCEIALKGGLCVLSGETGAGKSILLDALSLALGARADNGLVRRGESSGSVTAEFDIAANEQAKALLAQLELEDADTLIIRRSIGADGKTRCLVNDQPLTVTGLKKLGETLVEVHGQHDQRALQDAGIQRALLDDYAKTQPQRKTVAALHRSWREAMDAKAALQLDIERTSREQDYLRHMMNELKQLAPQAGEEDTLSDARARMMQTEKMFSLIRDAVSELNQGKGAISALRNAQRVLIRSPLSSEPAFAAIVEGFEKAAVEAEEAQYALERIGEQTSFNPTKLEQLEERLFELRAASRKYNMPVDALAAFYEEVAGKLALIESQEHRLGALEKQVALTQAAFVEAAQALSEMRKKAALKLEKAIAQELKPLKMENTHFHIRIEKLPESGWSEWGIDGVFFECATNVGKAAGDVQYAPLSKIASGGELSRFMLAMKVALSSVRSTPTLIFDEIDTGTGGAVAAAIGERLSVLGKRAQVLVVTHLPQVAARGDQHLLIEKQQKSGKITTSVEELPPAAREEELARMLAGATVTQEARTAARKLLEPVG